jgi:hypothetical protein
MTVPWYIVSEEERLLIDGFIMVSANSTKLSHQEENHPS